VSSFLLALVVASAHPAPALRTTILARAQQPGELVVLEVRGPEALSTPVVKAFSRSCPVYAVGAHTWRALVGIDLETAPGRYPVTVEATAAAAVLSAQTELIVRPRAFEVRSLKVDEAYVTPPAEVQARIAEEAATLKRIFAAAGPERLWAAGFVRPVPQPANSRFGSRSVFNGKPSSPHAGADFPSPAGTSVKAPNAGKVVLARALYFSGNTVILDHGLGLYSFLCHLSAIDVAEDQSVERGALIGRVGATGRVTGPHLHWAVRLGEVRLDPISLLAVLGVPAN
jgi:murein DD-endopeptidase MepM/ murein hydrolase activator NlpD